MDDINNTTYSSKNIKKYEFKENFNALCIKANMGIGKTKALEPLLKKYNKVVIVSFRISLDKQYVNNFPDFELYSDIKENTYETDIHPKIVIQIDSLYKLMGEVDLFILDEMTYTLNHLVTSAKKRNESYKTLIEYIKDSKYFISMDAFMTNDHVEWLYDLRKDINYIENTYKMHKDKKIINYDNNFGPFIDNIRKQLSDNKKIIVCSNSKKKIRFIKNIVDKEYKNKKGIFVDADSENKYNIDEWDTADIVGYTPTITAGISYENIRFDTCFGYFVNSSSCAEMSVQQLFRVRNISSKEYHICVETSGKKDYPESNEDIDKYICERTKCLAKGIDGINIKHISKTIEKDNYYKLFVLVQKTLFKSYNNYINRMLSLLKTQGITQSEYVFANKDENKSARKQYSTFTKLFDEMEIEKIVKMPKLDFIEADELKNKLNATYDEKLMLKKYNFEEIFQTNNTTTEIYKKYNKKGKIFNNIAYVCAYKEGIKEALSNRLNYLEREKENKQNIDILHFSKKYDKIALGIEMLNLFGFESLFDNNKITIDENKVKQYILNKENILELAFKTNRKNWKKIIDNESTWFKQIMKYINERLRSVFMVSIKLDSKNKKYYIDGLDFWSDISYNNANVLEKIRQNEINIYEEVEMEKMIMGIINELN